MAKYTLKDITTPGFQMPADYNELVSVYRTLAKTADQRLVRLEKYAEEPNMGDALKWSYARAMKDIEHWSGEQASRFNTTPPKTRQSLLAKITDIQTFLSKPSSTKSGIKNIYIKRANTINNNYGTDFTWQNIGDFYESEFYKKLEDKFNASKTVVEAIGTIRDNPKIIKDAIAAMEEEKNKADKDKKVLKLNDSDVVNDVIKQIIDNYPDEVKVLLEGNYKEL